MGDLGHVNSSGFPLQLGLERLVQETENEHGWHFLSREHPWQNKASGSDGFIDLIIEKDLKFEVMVIECKRVKDTSWIFLDPTKQANNNRVVNAWVNRDNGGKVYFDWKDMAVDPASPESSYCIVAGQDSKSRPMLERTAAELIEATEALAIEEYNIENPTNIPNRIYYPVIITTAELKVCNFDPSDINIKTGELQEKNCKFKTVPFIKFKKSLSQRRPNKPKFKNIMDVDSFTERTVIIVNSDSIVQLLKTWKLDLHSSALL